MMALTWRGSGQSPGPATVHTLVKGGKSHDLSLQRSKRRHPDVGSEVW